jgi:UDP-N-acetylmuramoyl-tripeptide--D-alanyl-D-alanine ligase
MVYWLKIIYLVLLVELILRDLYFWQLKEYRLDRFREFLRSQEGKKYFIPSRHFLRPKLTAKIVLLFLISLVLARQFTWWLGYLLTPALVALAVGAVNPWSGLIKWVVVLFAKVKLRLYHRDLLVIGITGSFGKTSTKEILAHVLGAKYRVLKTTANNNTLIGVAKAVLKQLNEKHEIFVVEMGAYKRGEIREICNLVRPKIGILTGINEQHAGLFGSLANTISAKSELIAALPRDGWALINGDNLHSKSVAAKSWPAAVKLYRLPKKRYQTNLVGDHQQLNISAAVMTANHLGVPKKDIEQKLKKIPVIATALKETKGLKGATIILDTYSSNRDGFMAAIKFCREFKSGRKILVTPGMSELGRLSDAVHHDVAKKAAAVFNNIYVTKADTGRWFKSAKFLTEDKLLRLLQTILTKQDLVLLEGRLSAKFVESLCRR